MADWKSIVGNVGQKQYEERIISLKKNGIDTSAIEKTVGAAIDNFKSEKGRSFIIFGEPQSGKTEMMIALNAKLLDEGCDVIINLLTDSVDLLQQSLSRFRAAGLSPSPKQFSDLPIEPKSIAKKQWVIFSKKNARDLEKLIEALRFTKSLVVIDDEADYASPNSKVNSAERTKINNLIYELLKDRGNYIGVTATPARLDLNNTFENVAYDYFHGLEVYKEHILKLGAPHVHLAGSGPALFTVFRDKSMAENLYTRCRDQGMEVYLAGIRKDRVK